MKLVRNLVIVLVALVAVAYVGAIAYMFFNQRALQYVATGPITPLAQTALSEAEEVAIPSGGSVVNGWYQAPSQGMPLILYYRGNSGSFSAEHQRFEQFVADGYGFLSFDYRGFPMSPGEISETNVLTDAIAAYDWAAEKGAPILVWGRSLGSGPATYVASQRDARALMLETPFLSATTVAGERYPYLPVALVMQDKYHNDQWIKDVTEPVFVAHGTADTVVGVTNGERLYALAPKPDGIWIEPGADHSDLWAAGIWNHAKAFFERAMAE